MIVFYNKNTVTKETNIVKSVVLWLALRPSRVKEIITERYIA